MWWKFGRSKYAENFEFCATADCSFLFPRFVDKLKCDSRIIYQEHPSFKEYINKKVLIIGGGDSTNNFDKLGWDKLDTYDYVWSVNHFFLHPVLKNKKLDLVMMMGEPDLTSYEWISYRNKFKPVVGFEINEKWINYKFDDYKDYICMHTSDYTILGACVRMIEFACVLGVSSIDFIGLDGVQSISKGKHAFQPGKTTLPTILQTRARHSTPYKFSKDSVNIFKDLYSVFWKRITKDFPEVKFKNLGGGEEYHEISMRNNSV